jgi:hypothetical protein
VRRTPVGTAGPAGTFTQRRPVFQTEPEEEEQELAEKVESRQQPKETVGGAAKIEDKIKNIISRNPDLSAYKIKKVLNSSKFGYTRVGWFSIRSILKDMGLGSRKSRKEFAQKQAKTA